MKVFPPFRLDTVNQCLWRSTEDGGEERITLKPKTYSILAYFVAHPGRLVTQHELLEAVWPDTYVQPEVVKRHIFDLREALGDDSKTPLFLETLPRRGYRFIAPIHEAEHSYSRTSPGAKLVGREPALSELESCLHRAMGGQRQIVFVTGEAGIGKTALVDEFRRRAAESMALWLTTGQCVEGYGGKEPYYAVLEAFGSLCRYSDDVLRILATQAPTWLAQFPALIREDQRETLQREIMGATRQRMLREIVVAVETISSDKPLLLTIEDLHWACHSTIDFIAALARSRAPAKLLLIATHRPADVASAGHPLKSVEQELLIHRLCHRFHLEPLEEEDIAEYLAGGSSEIAVPQGLAALLKRHSEGNPLFMLAALEHLLQCGFIRKEADSWTLGVPLDQIGLEVPESLRDMIDAQIENLDPEVQRILEVASTNGVQFSSGVSAVPASVDEERFEQICEDLSRRRVLRRLGSSHFPDGSISSRYEFSHALYREVLYRRLAPARLTRTHRQIGERLERLYAGHEHAIAAELAEHFEHSNDWPSALKYLRLAAEGARRRYANREAGVILRRALGLCANLSGGEQAEWQIRILTILGMMYAADSDVRAIETLESAVNLALQQGSVDVQARALGDWLLPLSWVSSSRAMEAVSQALVLSESLPGLARAMSRQNCHFFRIWLGEWNDADEAACVDALGEIRDSGDLVARCYFEAQYALLRWVSSEYREADQILSQSVSNLMGSCEATHVNLLLLYWVHQMFGSTSLAMAGEWGQALERFRAAISSLEKNGDDYRARIVRVYQAWAHLFMLDFEGVLRLCASSYPNPERAAQTEKPILGDPIPIDARICLILRGSAKLGAGQIDAALADLSIVRDAMDRQQILLDWYWRMPLHSALTEVWLKKGDLEKARWEAQEFLTASLNTRERTFQALAWETNARIAMISGDHASVADCIGKALSIVEQWEIPLAAWRVHATAAEAATAPELAHAQWRLSAETITRLADSLSPTEPLREIFLSAPPIRRILDTQRSRASHL